MVEFDEVKESGFFRALYLTWKKSLFSPETFYENINVRENVLPGEEKELPVIRPFFYAIIFTYINLVLSFFWEVIFFKIGFYKNYAVLPKIPLFFTDKRAVILYVIIGVIVLLLLLGILYSIFLALLTAVIHGFILLMGGKNNFRNTFRVITYASGVGVFSIFPIFGFNISAAWFAALLVVGIKKTNGITTQKSIMAILLPFVSVSVIILTFLVKIIAGH